MPAKENSNGYGALNEAIAVLLRHGKLVPNQNAEWNGYSFESKPDDRYGNPRWIVSYGDGGCNFNMLRDNVKQAFPDSFVDEREDLRIKLALAEAKLALITAEAEIKRLKDENKCLKDENKRLKDENKRLKDENKSLTAEKADSLFRVSPTKEYLDECTNEYLDECTDGYLDGYLEAVE